MRLQREIKKDPANAVVQVEKILEDEPQHKQANLALKEAAGAAGWLETGVFALQTALEGNAEDTKVMHELAKLYSELGDHENEVRMYALANRTRRMRRRRGAARMRRHEAR